MDEALTRVWEDDFKRLTKAIGTDESLHDALLRLYNGALRSLQPDAAEKRAPYGQELINGRCPLPVVPCTYWCAKAPCACHPGKISGPEATVFSTKDRHD